MDQVNRISKTLDTGANSVARDFVYETFLKIKKILKTEQTNSDNVV